MTVTGFHDCYMTCTHTKFVVDIGIKNRLVTEMKYSFRLINDWIANQTHNFKVQGKRSYGWTILAEIWLSYPGDTFIYVRTGSIRLTSKHPIHYFSSYPSSSLGSNIGTACISTWIRSPFNTTKKIIIRIILHYFTVL